MNDIALKIVMAAVIILGCILIKFGLHGSGALITIGFALVAVGIIVQIASFLMSLFKAISDRIKEKKAEKEEDSVGLGIK